MTVTTLQLIPKIVPKIMAQHGLKLTLNQLTKYCIANVNNEANRDAALNFKMHKRAGGVAKAVEPLPSKCKALSSNPSTVSRTQ
jgi:hypothetical protein